LGPTQELTRLDSGWNDAISSLRPVATTAAAGNPERTAERLYRALLGRDGDPDGLRNAATQIRAGKLTDLVRGMAQSPEFRSLSGQRSASEILDQIYGGLYGRRADTTARNAYLSRIERGDAAGVVLDVMAAEEGGAANRDPAPIAGGVEVQAKGSGVVIWGGKKYFDTVSGAKVLLGRDGRMRINFTGSTSHTLNGTWSQETNGFARVRTIDLPDKPSVAVEGGVLLDHDQLARIDVTAGTQGTRDRVVYTFVAQDFVLPREETLCQQEIRARLEKEKGSGVKVAFLAPRLSRLGSDRQELRGEVVLLSENVSAEYRCEVDTRRGQVIDASVRR